MARRVATWIVRFAVAVVIYAVIANLLIESAQGWDRLGRFIAAIAFGGLAAVAWGVAIGIGLRIANTPIRHVIHPPLTMLLFLGLSLVVVGWFMETPAEFLWRDLRPFAALMVGVSIVDAAVGWLLERWAVAPRQPI